MSESKTPTAYLDAFNLPPATRVTIEKTYPPEIEPYRAILQAELVKHLTAARERARRLPSGEAWRVIERAEREIAPVREALMRIEVEHARVRMIVPAAEVQP